MSGEFRNWWYAIVGWARRLRWLRRPGLLELFARYLLLFKLTPYGKACVLAWLFSIALAFASLETPVHQIFAAISCVVCLSFIYGHGIRPTVRITGALPEQAIAGQPIVGRFKVKNEGAGTARDFAIGYFDYLAPVDGSGESKTVPFLEPGETQTLEVALKPHRRGVYTVPGLLAYTTFPFSLWRFGTHVTLPRPMRQRLLVLPAFTPFETIDIPVAPRYQPGGVAMTSHVGESAEYIGNREYRPGDSVRRIDARSWARLARPIVREYQEEYFARVALILDTYVPPRTRVPRAGIPQLEAAVSLSASLGDVLTRGEYLIDLFAAGPELYVFRAGRHTAHFDNVLEILACIDPCRTDPFVTLAPALTEELQRISTVIAVFMDWDESRKRIVQAALHAGCAVKLYIVREGRTTAPLEEAEHMVGAVARFTPDTILAGNLAP